MASTIRGKLVRTRPVMESLTPEAPWPLQKVRPFTRTEQSAIPGWQEPIPSEVNSAHGQPPGPRASSAQEYPRSEERPPDPTFTSRRRGPSRAHFPQARPVSGTLPETSQPSTAPPRTRRGVPAASADANHLDEVLTRRRLNVIGDWRWGGIEPPSNSQPRILLRAQSTVLFLGPRHCIDSPPDGLS